MQLYQIHLLYWCNLKEITFSSTALLIADSCLLSYTRFVFVLALGLPAYCQLPTVTLWCVYAPKAQANIPSAYVPVQVKPHPVSSTDHSCGMFSALGFLSLVKIYASDTRTLSWEMRRLMNVDNMSIY